MTLGNKWDRLAAAEAEYLTAAEAWREERARNRCMSEESRAAYARHVKAANAFIEAESIALATDDQLPA